MELDIRHQNVTIDRELKDHVEQCVGTALNRFERRVASVTVRMKDTNGPRGGVDKVCKIEVQMKPRGTLLVEESSADVMSAVSLASDRLRQKVRREMDRAKTSRKTDRTSASGVSTSRRATKKKAKTKAGSDEA